MFLLRALSQAQVKTFRPKIHFFPSSLYEGNSNPSILLRRTISIDSRLKNNKDNENSIFLKYRKINTPQMQEIKDHYYKYYAPLEVKKAIMLRSKDGELDWNAIIAIHQMLGSKPNKIEESRHLVNARGGTLKLNYLHLFLNDLILPFEEFVSNVYSAYHHSKDATGNTGPKSLHQLFSFYTYSVPSFSTCESIISAFSDKGNASSQVGKRANSSKFSFEDFLQYIVTNHISWRFKVHADVVLMIDYPAFESELFLNDFLGDVNYNYLHMSSLDEIVGPKIVEEEDTRMYNLSRFLHGKDGLIFVQDFPRNVKELQNYINVCGKPKLILFGNQPYFRSIQHLEAALGDPMQASKEYENFSKFCQEIRDFSKVNEVLIHGTGNFEQGYSTLVDEFFYENYFLFKKHLNSSRFVEPVNRGQWIGSSSGSDGHKHPPEKYNLRNMMKASGFWNYGDIQNQKSVHSALSDFSGVRNSSVKKFNKDQGKQE